MKTVYVVTVEADHAFGDLVARGAFLDQGNARAWGDAQAALAMTKARAADPTFDAYHFTVSVLPLDVIDA